HHAIPYIVFYCTAPSEIYTLSLHDALPISQLDEAGLVRDHARRTVKIRIDRSIVRIVGVDVLAGGVAVPDLHRRAADRGAVLVDDARAQVDQLADRALLPMAGEVAAQRLEAAQHLLRAAQLRGGEGAALQRLRRPAHFGLRVAGLDAGGLGARGARLDQDLHGRLTA